MCVCNTSDAGPKFTIEGWHLKKKSNNTWISNAVNDKKMRTANQQLYELAYNL